MQVEVAGAVCAVLLGLAGWLVLRSRKDCSCKEVNTSFVRSGGSDMEQIVPKLECVVNSSEELRNILSGDPPPITHLYCMNLGHLWSGVFDGLDRLVHVRINGSLEELPDRLFDYNVRLKAVQIDNTKIKVLPIGLFDHLPNLESIAIHNNTIAWLPHDMFTKMSLTVKLEMYNNKLVYLPDSIGPWCCISILFNGIRYGVQEMKELSARHRELRLQLISDPLKSQYLDLYHLIK